MPVEDFLALTGDQRSGELEKIAQDIVSLLNQEDSASTDRATRGTLQPVAEAHPRAADLFVGRSEELERLEALLFPDDGTRRPS